MSEQVWWYATRAAGLMTWSTATAAVIVGLMLSTRVIRNRTGPWFLDLHRYLGGISIIFLVTHLVTLYFDSYVEFGPRELLVPGESTWEPEAIAWGIIAAWVLVAVEVTSLLRSRIRNQIWRFVHGLSFVTVAAGTYHAYLAGSDVESPITWSIAGLGSVLVVGLVAARLRRHAHEDPHGATQFPDQQALLMEMRQRLEDLPIPESMPQPHLTTGAAGVLPRRAPHHPEAPESPLDALPGTTPAAPEFGSDPFAAVPQGDAHPDLGNWVEPSTADPFAARPLDPFRHTTNAPVDPTRPDDPSGPRYRARPFTDAEIEADDGRDLFDAPPAPTGAPQPLPRREPGGGLAQPSSPWPTPPGADPPSPFPTPTADPAPGPFGETGASQPVAEQTAPTNLFGHPEPDEPTAEPNTAEPITAEPLAAEPIGNPFEPADPPTESITDLTGPPPLPTDAVDPITGEPDEAAYGEWLKDWLAYAERYGDEAPGDPARV